MRGLLIFTVCMQEFEDLECFAAWPIVPTLEGTASLTPLQASMLVWEHDAEEVSALACSALQKLGIRSALLSAPQI